MNKTPKSRRSWRFDDTLFRVAVIGIVATLGIVLFGLILDSDEPTGLAAPWEMTSKPVDGSRYTHTPYLVPGDGRYVSAQVQVGGDDGDLTGFTFTARDRADLKPLLVTLYRNGEDPATLDDGEHPEPNQKAFGVKPGTYQVIVWHEATGNWKTEVQRVTPAEVTSPSASN